MPWYKFKISHNSGHETVKTVWFDEFPTIEECEWEAELFQRDASPNSGLIEWWRVDKLTEEEIRAHVEACGRSIQADRKMLRVLGEPAKYEYDYPMPAVTVDVVVLRRKDSLLWETLLIRRGRDPYKGMWAIPGGHVEKDEDLPDAALRELEEETGVKSQDLSPPNQICQLGAYGAPGRDPRGWYVSVAYIAVLDIGQGEVEAGDDAAEVGWFNIYDLPKLAFDHGEIMIAAKRVLLEGPQENV